MWKKVLLSAALILLLGLPRVEAAGIAAELHATNIGGCTPYHLTSAASTNSTLVSAGAHTLCSLTVINTTATIYYLRLYDLAVAPTCSSATGAATSYPVPASATGAGFAQPFGSSGVAFLLGLGFCLTGGGGDTDNTNAATGVYINATYK